MGFFPEISGRRDTFFIQWDNIACYEILTIDQEKPIENREAPFIMIHLRDVKSKSKYLHQGFPITYNFTGIQLESIRKTWLKAINRFIKELKKKGISEIPRNCKNCGQQVDPPLRKCRFCDIDRW
jgi:hypothetical protein